MPGCDDPTPYTRDEVSVIQIDSPVGPTGCVLVMLLKSGLLAYLRMVFEPRIHERLPICGR